MITYFVTTRSSRFLISLPLGVSKRAVSMVLCQLGIKHETVSVFI